MLVALSLPPFGFWPLGVLGLAVFAARLHGRPVGARAALGAGAGIGQYTVGLWWVKDFNVAGFVALVVIYAALTAVVAAAVPAAAGRRRGVLSGLPGLLVLSEWVRGHVPFGGLPIGGLALGQAAGPLAPTARIGGTLLVTGVTALAGAAAGTWMMPTVAGPELARQSGSRLRHWRASPDRAVTSRRATSEPARQSGRRLTHWRASSDRAVTSRRATSDPARQSGSRVAHWRASSARRLLPGLAALGVVVALVAAGRLGPDGAGPNLNPTVRVAAVQGGGPRGLHAVESDPAVPLQRQLEASATIPPQPPVDLVVWPEDAVQVGRPIAKAPEGDALGRVATRLRATLVAGVVEDVGPDRFRNAAVAWGPSGVIVARFDKVHRVPFGEYIPGRSFVGHLASLALVPRDAIAGHGSGILDTPAGPLGTVISYEVFFEDRARAAVRAGGEVLVVPTNASSYRSSQVPAQQLAAARLRAWETGRDVVQAAPTGYSAIIGHDGHVRARSTLGRRQVVAGTVALRDGRTVFVRSGDLPVLLLAAAGLGAAVWRRRPPG